VHAELAEPAETIALGGRTLCFWKISTRRGCHSSFCSLWPNLNKKARCYMNQLGWDNATVGCMPIISYLPYPPKPQLPNTPKKKHSKRK